MSTDHMNQDSVVRILLRQHEDLPGSWHLPDGGGPTPAATEELTWSMLLAACGQLLFDDPLHPSVTAGRERVVFEIDDAAWSAFQGELGLLESDARREMINGLARILRRETLPRFDGSSALGDRAAGVLHLLDGFSRHARGGRKATPRQGTLGFDRGGSRFQDAVVAVDALLGWAGEAGTTPADRYRVAFHVLWKPLSRRSWRDVVTPPEQAVEDLALPVDFLQKARTGDATAAANSEPAPAPRPTPREPEPPMPGATPDDHPSRAALQEILQGLADPLLSARGAPATLLAEAEAATHGLACDLIRAWQRALGSGELEIYGAPGEVFSIRLPDRAWRLADGPFRAFRRRGATSVRVVRRGVRLHGEVLVAGVVVVEDPRARSRS